MASKDARSSPPIAMRIVRPYGTEAELLAHEASAFTRTGVVLIGAPSRPNGVVLRFEIALKDGSSLMRGEGRVVGYKAPMANEEGALMLRFTRLDVKSKSLLDKAVAIREERRSLAPPPPRHAPHPPPAHGATHEAAPPPPVAPVEPPPSSRRGAPASVSPQPPSVRPGLPSTAPVSRPSTPAIPVPDDDPGEAEGVDDADLEAAEETVLDTAALAVEPVASQREPSPIDQAVDDLLAAPIAAPQEPAPPPQPSPANVPQPHPFAPPQPATPVRSPEHAPAPRIAPEKAPPPQRSPEPARRLDPTTRASALDRLRARAKKLAEMPSYFPVGERSTAEQPQDARKIEPGHTPVLGSLVAEREK